MPISVYTVFLAALLTALATGLGALPFLFTKRFTARHEGLANAMAAGLMLAASLMLMYEGVQRQPTLMFYGMTVGAGLIIGMEYWLSHARGIHVSELKGADARKALLIIGVMTVHSLTEGVGVGVSYAGGEALGVFITLAIAVHNIPEGLAISLVLVPRGVSAWKAGGWSIFSSLPQPLMAVPAFLLVDFFHPFLPFGLGFAAGAMIWMTVHELIPDALQKAPRPAVAGVAFLAFCAMMAFQFFLK